MNSKQFTVGDVTYEVHQKSIRDSLRVDWLNSQFFNAGYREARFSWAFAFVNFLVSTTVVAGDPPDWMVPTESDFVVLIPALELWLDETNELAVAWEQAAKAVELSGNREELSPQADPNA